MKYTFKWGKKAVSGKNDPAHTISNLEADAYLDYWISTMRRGCPWQLVGSDGTVARSGVA